MLLDGDIAYFMTTKKHIQFIRQIVGKENYADVKDVMIMGGGRTTVHVAEGMPDFYTLKIIEQNEERCMQLNEILDDSDIRIIQGDGRDTALLIDEGLKDVQAFAALTPETETNILACLTAKRMGVRKTVALVENMDYVSMAEKLDIGTIINKKMIAAGHIHQMMLRSDAANVKCLTIANADVAELLANEESPITKAEVKDLRLPVGVTLGGLVRDGVGQPIYGNTRIQAGDYVVLFCKGGLIKKMDHYFAKPTSAISRIKSSFSS
jgi:trk system potassium uptake protein TrkA